jgi:hypothetical protein
MRGVATAAFPVLLAVSATGFAQGKSSLTDFESRHPAAPATTGVQPEDENVAALKERLVLAESRIKALSESAATTAMEAEIFKRKASELQDRLEALGLASLGEDPSGIEARLLQAIRELRVLKERNNLAAEQLVRLSEKIGLVLQSNGSPGPELREAVEIELRRTSEILGDPTALETDPVAPDLGHAMVINHREDLGLVVANVGALHGVKLGMPFRIMRGSRRIADAIVVDVRERISGAVIQNPDRPGAGVEEGDILRVDVSR